MLVKEFRIVLPISVEEYRVGQLYAIAEASKQETGAGQGVEVLVNEPYEKDGESGQYTHKIYHMNCKLPKLITMVAPKGSLICHEKAWNAYPNCRTIITNEYMKNDFLIKIETMHKPDMGEEDNVHGLDAKEWKKAEVVHINIADKNQVSTGDYDPDTDPAIFKSEKTGRSPLGPDWKNDFASDPSRPHMCAYKLVSVHFKWRGCQNKVENYIQRQEKRMFTLFHRQLFRWIDKWIDLSMDDIRLLEDETKRELDEIRKNGEYRGMGLTND